MASLKELMLSESKVCGISHYWYFLNKEFKFQSFACNRCHYLLMMSINLEAINFLQNIGLTEKGECYEK